MAQTTTTAAALRLLLECFFDSGGDEQTLTKTGIIF
jgi:hypothetical protein